MSEVKYDDGFIAQAAPIVQDRYTKKEATNGRMLFFKNGRLTAESDIPEGTVIEDLTPMQSKETLAGDVQESPIVEAQCAFGDGKGTRQRLYNGQTIRLCQAHYETVTLGKIAQHVREGSWTT
jgi:uncharacterized protein YkvS